MTTIIAKLAIIEKIEVERIEIGGAVISIEGGKLVVNGNGMPVRVTSSDVEVHGSARVKVDGAGVGFSYSANNSAQWLPWAGTAYKPASGEIPWAGGVEFDLDESNGAPVFDVDPQYRPIP